MDGAWLSRLRWRWRGAWLWPTFAVLTVVDGVIGNALPPTGETETVVAAVLFGLVLNVIAVLLLSRPLGAVLRRRHRHFPTVVARNYGGALAVGLVSLALLTLGLAHRPTVLAHGRALQDAIARAEAWIGDRAPPDFRPNAARMNTFTIQAGSVYRTCVPSIDGRRSYCVIVRTQLPFAHSVNFDGYEPNSVFAAGVG